MIRKINKRLVFVLIDILFVIFSYFLILLVAKENSYLYHFMSRRTLYSIIMTSVLYIVALNVIRFYNYMWIYMRARDYYTGFMFCSLVVIFTTVVSGITSGIFLNIRYVFASGIISTTLIICSRAAIRIVYVMMKDYYNEHEEKQVNMLVVGAGSAASLAIRALTYESNSYNVVGAIDDDISKLGLRVYGVKVLGTRNDIIEICKKYKVKEILFAIPSSDEKNKHEILDICSETGCKIKIMPNAVAFFNKVELKKDVRDIQVEDLLQRDKIELDTDKISEYIKGNVALVTGGGGSIGSELCRQIAAYLPKQLIIVDIYENNAYDIQNELKATYPQLNLEVLIASVRDKERLDKIFEKYRPDIVFHAAAHKHVPLMEDSSGEAIKNNVKGTLNTCLCSDKYNVKKFVLISTDKAVNPTNVMGASKRMCEMIVQSINNKSKTDFVAVRFGNVLGSNGSVVPLFKRQIESGGPVTVTHREITRYFMLIPEAAQLVLEAATFAKGGEIFVLDMGSPVKIYDLARKMIKLSGFEVDKDIYIEFTGLRPGEKLYEELLMDEEGLAGTTNKKIFVARPSDIDFDKLTEDIDELMELAKDEKITELRDAMKKVVPTFKEEVYI